MMEFSFSAGFFIRLVSEKGSCVSLYPASEWPFSKRVLLLPGVDEEEYSIGDPKEAFIYAFKTSEEKVTFFRKMMFLDADEFVIHSPRSSIFGRVLEEPWNGFIFTRFNDVKNKAVDMRHFVTFCTWDH
jgi:hypothetical protein